MVSEGCSVSKTLSRPLALILFITAALFIVPGAAAKSLAGPGASLQVHGAPGQLTEEFSLRSEGSWAPVLSATTPVYVRTETGMQNCPISKAASSDDGLLITGDCGAGSFEQRIHLTADQDVFTVFTRLTLKKDASIYSVEDRYNFLPPRRSSVDEHQGPLDFVWSQDIKSEADDLVPGNSFKSPALMMQQGRLFAALLPHPNSRHVEFARWILM